MTRRDLIHRIAIGGVTYIMLPPMLSSCSKDEDEPDPPGNTPGEVDLVLDLNAQANAALRNPGGSLITRNILVINLGNDAFTALSSVCTHEGCQVGFNQSASNIHCPCHGSVFSTSGSVLNGPAVRALRVYPVSKEGDVLTITL
jgi:cytochrome b6-f complex iron-sulfur subunit